MFIKFFKNRLLSKLRHGLRNISDNRNISYSQCGEDLVVRHLLGVLGVSNVSYLDVGAHHPQYLSNTYLFYLNGSRGVCVEPDPSLYQEFVAQRSSDTNLNCGVGAEPGNAEFYVMSTSTLNTFSRDEAQRYQSYGTHQILKTLNIRLRTINEILEDNFTTCPHFVSLDVEGLDFVILNSLDFNKYRPQVFCLETLSFTEDKSERKLTEIIDLMHANGYMTYADTYINTIFVDKAAWERRP
jgi:FkbM family methyltransferase